MGAQAMGEEALADAVKTLLSVIQELNRRLTVAEHALIEANSRIAGLEHALEMHNHEPPE